MYFIAGKIPPKMVLEGILFGQSKLREQTPDEKRMDELVEQLSTLSNKDEWWFWKRIGGKESLNSLPIKLKKQQMRMYLNSFKEIFDNEWWSSTCKRQRQRKKSVDDPLPAFGGQFPVLRILRLGECIHHLRKNDKLPDDLIERLKNEKSFWSAATELEIASCFIQVGFDLDPYPSIPSGSKPEGKVTIDGTDTDIYYEVTEQHWSGLEVEAQKYESRVIDWLSKKCDPLNGSLIFKSEQNNTDEKIEELLNLLEKHYKSRSFDPLPFKFKNDDFEIYLEKADINGGWISIHGLEPATERIVRNWVNRLLEKAKQLPSGESCVIIGSPLFLWEPDEVKYVYNEVQKKWKGGLHSRISGIILCAKHVENSGLIKHVPFTIINSNVKIDNRERIEKMAQALFRFPDWL
jgi:hypothetical protein